jgi:hypothetical protein
LQKKRAAFAAADVALAASGTVSLELAAAETPMVVAYDMSWMSRKIIGAMLKVDTVTLVNLVSDTRAVPEFLGPDCRPEPIAGRLRDLLSDEDARHGAARRDGGHDAEARARRGGAGRAGREIGAVGHLRRRKSRLFRAGFAGKSARSDREIGLLRPRQAQERLRRDGEDMPGRARRRPDRVELQQTRVEPRADRAQVAHRRHAPDHEARLRPDQPRIGLAQRLARQRAGLVRVHLGCRPP